MAMSLDEYLALNYPLRLTPDPDGGYVFEFPDLPGCLGQIDSLSELEEHSEEAKSLWIELAFRRERPIPMPSSPDRFSGRILVRLSHSLHQRLSERAAEDGVSLNTYIATSLAETDFGHAIERRVAARLDDLCDRFDVLRHEVGVRYSGTPLQRRVVANEDVVSSIVGQPSALAA